MAAYSKWTATCLALLGLAGCASPAYYAQAVSGHFELMRQREPIGELVARADTDPQLAGRLAAAEAARRFAVDELGLPAGDSYTTYVRTGRDAVTWNVVVTPEFSLEPRRWCFPVAGCVPYRGYFDPDDARRFADAQSRRGRDAAVAPALAYSTLGWFDDPLLDTMLRYSDAQLAATLFHEMAHRRLYVPGDAAFNEAFAGFVEARGLERWLRSRGDDAALGSWRRNREVAREFRELVEATRAALQAIYRSEAPADEMRRAKRAAFDDLVKACAEKSRTRWNGVDPCAAWLGADPDNARIALIETYAGGQCAFEDLFAESGGDFRRFHRLAAARAALERTARRDWLGRPCRDIAPTGDL